MKSLLGIAAVFLAFFTLPEALGQQPVAPPKLTKTSDDSNPNLHQWKFEQATSTKLVAVVRVERFIMGTVVESFEEITFYPEDAVVGSLTVELTKEPPHVPRVTYPSMNNFLQFRVDPAWLEIKENERVIQCADGKRRKAREVEIIGKHETIRVSFYAAPPKMFAGKEPKLPKLGGKDMASLRQQFTKVAAHEFIIKGPNQEEYAEQIGVRPRTKLR